jgi:hypothetical protein
MYSKKQKEFKSLPRSPVLKSYSQDQSPNGTPPLGSKAIRKAKLNTKHINDDLIGTI